MNDPYYLPQILYVKKPRENHLKLQNVFPNTLSMLIEKVESSRSFLSIRHQAYFRL